MNVHTRLRNQRLGLEHSTSPLAHAAHSGLESLILLMVTNSFVFSLGPAFVSLVTTGLTTLATTALIAGISYLLTPKPPKPEDGKVPRREAIPPIIFAIGRNRIAGNLMLWDVAERGTQWRNYLFGVHALAGHRIQGFVQHYVNDDKVTVAENGNVTSVEDVESGDVRYQQGAVNIQTRLGETPETAYPEPVTAFSGIGLWTEDHRGDGTASSCVRFQNVSSKDFQKFYPGGAPKISHAFDGALMWDFRDEEQDPDDESTWAYSTNPAVALAWWTCFCPYGPLRDYHRVILPVLDIWQEEADLCDEMVPKKGGGTEKRYEVHGWATTETDPVAVENAIMAACDGWRVWRGDGALIFRCGVFREELVGAITDWDIVGHVVHGDVTEEDEINRLVPKITYPATDYTTADLDFFEDEEAQARVGRVLSSDANLQWVQNYRQGYRLAYREWLRIQERVSGTLDVRLTGINAVYSRWIMMDTPVRLPRLHGKLIENRRSTIALMKGGFQMDFRRHPEDIESYDPEVHEGLAPPIPPKPIQSVMEEAENIVVDVLSSGGSVYLRVSADDPGIENVSMMVRWRIKETGSGPGSWNELLFSDPIISGGRITVDTPPVPGDEVLEVQVKFGGGGIGGSGEWAPEPPVEVETTADTVAPGGPTDLSVNVTSGVATITFRAPNSGNFHAARVWRAPNAGTFGTATDISGRIFGSPNQVLAWVDDSPPAQGGTYKYWVTAENASGVSSAETGPQTGYIWGTSTFPYVAAMDSAPSTSLANAIDTLISSLKSSGFWDVCDWIGLHCVHIAQASRINLKNPAQVAAVVGTVTFTANQGNAGDGSTGYMTAGVNIDALTHYSQNAAHLGCWTNNDPGSLSANCVVGTAGSNQLLLPKNNAGSLSARVNGGSAFATGVGGDGSGYSVAVRSGANAVENFKNGVSVGTGTLTSAALGSVELWFLRGSTGYSTSQVSIIHVGGLPTAGQIAAAHTAFGAFRAAVGL